MLAIAICIGAFVLCFAATRHALWTGIAASMGVGYLYGIIRANVDSPVAQFVYDAALAGLFLATLTIHLRAAQRFRLRRLMPWVLCLIGWPTMLLLVPSQNPLIQLVGYPATSCSYRSFSSARCSKRRICGPWPAGSR